MHTDAKMQNKKLLIGAISMYAMKWKETPGNFLKSYRRNTLW